MTETLLYLPSLNWQVDWFLKHATGHLFFHCYWFHFFKIVLNLTKFWASISLNKCFNRIFIWKCANWMLIPSQLLSTTKLAVLSSVWKTWLQRISISIRAYILCWVWDSKCFCWLTCWQLEVSCQLEFFAHYFSQHDFKKYLNFNQLILQLPSVSK